MKNDHGTADASSLVIALESLPVALRAAMADILTAVAKYLRRPGQPGRPRRAGVSEALRLDDQGVSRKEYTAD